MLVWKMTFPTFTVSAAGAEWGWLAALLLVAVYVLLWPRSK
jgi:hypothetical protein